MPTRAASTRWGVTARSWAVRWFEGTSLKGCSDIGAAVRVTVPTPMCVLTLATAWAGTTTPRTPAATELGISPKTVETHVSSVLRKLQLSNRYQLSNWASERHLN